MKNSNNISSLFNPKKVPEDASPVLENFDSIVQGVLPLNSRQLLKLPEDILELSHQLTSERDTRRLSYMNDKTLLSAYTRYFMWWNLVRLTRLFSNIDFSNVNLSDDDICLDIGSGPLTCVTSLWLSRPELRSKKLTWYCLDLSQSALSLGENIYLSVASRTLTKDIESHWKIIRVKGNLGTPIRQKAKLVTCANVFNEIFQSETKPLDFLSKKYSDDLMRYGNENTSYLVIEPGVPRSARFISCLRDSFIRKNLSIIAPCCHTQICPMDGRLLKGAHVNKTTENKKTGKWCNFAFPVKNAPEKLQKLSAKAKLAKDRAVLSFVFACPQVEQNKGAVSLFKDKSSLDEEKSLLLRIASDPIRLGDKIGFYACSKLGLALYIPKKEQLVFSGDLISVKSPEEIKRDQKSGAVIVE